MSAADGQHAWRAGTRLFPLNHGSAKAALHSLLIPPLLSCISSSSLPPPPLQPGLSAATPATPLQLRANRKSAERCRPHASKEKLSPVSPPGLGLHPKVPALWAGGADPGDAPGTQPHGSCSGSGWEQRQTSCQGKRPAYGAGANALCTYRCSEPISNAHIWALNLQGCSSSPSPRM